nr:unnamed protein product [Callosobruchus analis]
MWIKIMFFAVNLQMNLTMLLFSMLLLVWLMKRKGLT